MPATYKGLNFNTPLLARWACFFDLAGWKWWANPQAIENWQPDFKVEFSTAVTPSAGQHTPSWWQCWLWTPLMRSKNTHVDMRSTGTPPLTSTAIVFPQMEEQDSAQILK